MSIETLNARVRAAGGTLHQRMVKTKLISLLDALHRTYQGQTAILNGDREFKCLINKNRENEDYNNKMISIPYEDIQINGAGKQPTNIKCGDTFTWKENNTHWIIYFQYLEEEAYFRGLARQCEDQIELEGKSYWVYIRGPQETEIIWNKNNGVVWNDLNYNLIMYISLDEYTLNKLQRFSKIKIKNARGEDKTWEVQAINPYKGYGIIMVGLKEYFENPYKEEAAPAQEMPPQEGIPTIMGPREVKAYDYVSYSIVNATGGNWYVNNIDFGTDDTITFEVKKLKGKIEIEYRKDGSVFDALTANIKAL